MICPGGGVGAETNNHVGSAIPPLSGTGGQGGGGSLFEDTWSQLADKCSLDIFRNHIHSKPHPLQQVCPLFNDFVQIMSGAFATN